MTGPSEEHNTGCVILKNKPVIREHDNCANFLKDAKWEFPAQAVAGAGPTDTNNDASATMPNHCQCVVEGTCADPGDCSQYMTGAASTGASFNSAEWMRERVFASSNSTHPQKRCYIHMGEEGASQYNAEKKIRSCWDYYTFKKSADWDMNGTV